MIRHDHAADRSIGRAVAAEMIYIQLKQHAAQQPQGSGDGGAPRDPPPLRLCGDRARIDTRPSTPRWRTTTADTQRTIRIAAAAAGPSGSTCTISGTATPNTNIIRNATTADSVKPSEMADLSEKPTALTLVVGDVGGRHDCATMPWRALQNASSALMSAPRPNLTCVGATRLWS